MMRSLRDRLLFGMILGMMLLLLVFSVVIYTLIRRTLFQQFDNSLGLTAQMLAAAARYETYGEDIRIGFHDKIIPEFEGAQRPAYYQFWAADGRVLLRSPSLGGGDLACFRGDGDEAVFRGFRLRNGQPGRAVGLEFRPGQDKRDTGKDESNPGQQAVTLVVAQSVADLNLHLRSVRELLIIASVGTITLSFLVASFVVREGLSPFKFLAADIAAISEDDLTTRISTEPMPTEMVPVKDTLNDLLCRLQDSFSRERRFTANVAHELRTPLAGMRSTLEVTLRRIRNLDEYRFSLSDCLAIAKNMQAMMDNLLALAHLDAHEMTFERDRIHLAEMMDACWEPYLDIAVDRNIVFDNQLDRQMACESDAKGLSIVLSNLLENAAEYTEESGKVWTTGRQLDGSVEITIANTGCTLTDEQIAHVFDCFWRGDSSRTDTGVHCGLGLALVERVVKALGGSAGVELQEEGIFVVKLALPISRLSPVDRKKAEISEKTGKRKRRSKKFEKK